MREALEQVKQELGEDALVLDTRRVRDKGFLGFGASEMIEVRVAAEAESPSASAAAKRNSPTPPRRKQSTSLLNLTDDTPAAPPRAAKADRALAQTYSTASARAAAGSIERSSNAPAADSTDEAMINPVELAETAPRIVHRRPASLANVSAPPPAASAPRAEAPTSQPNQLNTELERLRAELREVKFSLGAFAARPVVEQAVAPNALGAFEEDSAIYDSPYYETYLELTATGLQPELARRAVRAATVSGTPETRRTGEIGRDGLVSALSQEIAFADDPLAQIPGTSSSPSAVVFIGPTGVGKTTTIAKLAARVALRARRRVELITLDTYRIAAVEQLKTYAEIIGAGCHIARSVVELDALTRRFEGQATVLIDTVGRSPHDLADQMELADYLRASENLLKCLVLQATTHPADAQAAVRKFALYGADRLVITKLDETTRPGAAVGVAGDASLPLVYLCAGQRVPEDIEGATPEAFAARVLRITNAVSTVQKG